MKYYCILLFQHDDVLLLNRCGLIWQLNFIVQFDVNIHTHTHTLTVYCVFWYCFVTNTCIVSLKWSSILKSIITFIITFIQNKHTRTHVRTANFYKRCCTYYCEHISEWFLLILIVSTHCALSYIVRLIRVSSITVDLLIILHHDD
jgi:hypothetical protein